MYSRSNFVPVLVAGLLVAILGSVIAFAVPFLHVPAFWVNFAFFWLALALVVAINVVALSSARSSTSMLYRVSITTVSVAYLLVSALFGFVGMALLLPIWLTILVQVIFAVACVFGVLGGEMGARLVEQDEDRTASQTSFVSAMRIQADSIALIAPEGEAREAAKRLAEAFRYSDPVSSPASFAIEADLSNNMAQLDNAARTGNAPLCVSLCAYMQSALEQRNALCRATKRERA